MKQPNRKTKKRRLKDIHTIAKGYKSPFLRDLLHQPKEDLVLTLMLRRIKSCHWAWGKRSSRIL